MKLEMNGISTNDSTCRIAVLSMHTSPLEQPGGGDSGGMNVYIREVAEEMAKLGLPSDIFTRRTSPDQPDVCEPSPLVRVFNIDAGPARPVHKDLLRGLVGRFYEQTRRVIETNGGCDVIHAHYWLSGTIGARLKRDLDVPLVVSFHTLARVKDSARSGEDPEPHFRSGGEQRVIDAADAIVAATEDEERDLTTLYNCEPTRVRVVNPGVDLDVFSPGSRAAARERLGFAGVGPLIAFVGRLQRLKGPHVALGALRQMRQSSDAHLVVVGDESPKGSFGERMRLGLMARSYGLSNATTFMDPVAHNQLVDVYRAADAVIIPSATESFGLVALEAAACGTPVVATDVGGLRKLVVHGETGYLVAPRTASAFARAAARVVEDSATRDRMGNNARRLAERFPWSQTARGLIDAYASVSACEGVRSALLRGGFPVAGSSS